MLASCGGGIVPSRMSIINTSMIEDRIFILSAVWGGVIVGRAHTFSFSCNAPRRARFLFKTLGHRGSRYYIG